MDSTNTPLGTPADVMLDVVLQNTVAYQRAIATVAEAQSAAATALVVLNQNQRGFEDALARLKAMAPAESKWGIEASRHPYVPQPQGVTRA